MLPHGPFDGWTWIAMEKGAFYIGFEQSKTESKRINIYKNLFHNGAIDFIEVFSEVIDIEVKNNYNDIENKPQRIPEKIKKLILMRLSLCHKYKESIRSSLSITALPTNSKKSIKLLYRTCNSMCRISGDNATDFSFYTNRISLAAVYSSTLFFWLNDESIDNKNTEQFLDRRLNDISKISKFKKPFNELQSFYSNLKNTKNNINIKYVFDIIKQLIHMKNSTFIQQF